MRKGRGIAGPAESGPCQSSTQPTEHSYDTYAVQFRRGGLQLPPRTA